jgi:neural Wiskott-Aldrich syndrome protein
VPLANKLKPNAKPKAKSKREHVSDVEAEELSFGQPARQMKRARSSSGGGLALPSRSSTVLPQGPVLASPQRNAHNDSIDSDEEEWDEVAAAPSVSTATAFQPTTANDSDASDEEEIDMNAFEAEMNKHLDPSMGSDDDFLAAAVMSEPETPVRGGGRPISLNQFAGGTEASQDDDDYSSSEESDED